MYLYSTKEIVEAPTLIPTVILMGSVKSSTSFLPLDSLLIDSFSFLNGFQPRLSRPVAANGNKKPKEIIFRREIRIRSYVCEFG